MLPCERAHHGEWFRAARPDGGGSGHGGRREQVDSPHGSRRGRKIEGQPDMIRCMKMSILGGALLATASVAVAQSWGPRDLDELKQEAQRRSERRLPPVGNVKPDDMREA